MYQGVTQLYSGQRVADLRHPFFDHGLVETVFAVPMDLQMSRTVTKPLLRRALRPLLPPVVTARKFNARLRPAHAPRPA